MDHRQSRAPARGTALLRQSAAGTSRTASSMMRSKTSRRARWASCWCGATAPMPRAGFFSGYYKDEAATEQAWAGGWFHTGDLVRAGRGRLVLLRRSLKKHDSPQRREHRRRRSRERAASSSRRSRVGRLSRARRDAGRGGVCLRRAALPGAGLDERPRRSCSAHCRQALAYYKAPGYIGFCEALAADRFAEARAGADQERGEEAPSKTGKPSICGDLKRRDCRSSSERQPAARARDYVLGLNYFL